MASTASAASSSLQRSPTLAPSWQDWLLRKLPIQGRRFRRPRTRSHGESVSSTSSTFFLLDSSCRQTVPCTAVRLPCRVGRLLSLQLSLLASKSCRRFLTPLSWSPLWVLLTRAPLARLARFRLSLQTVRAAWWYEHFVWDANTHWLYRNVPQKNGLHWQEGSSYSRGHSSASLWAASIH